MSSTNKIINGNLWSQTLIYFFPILLGSMLQQLYNTVDAVVVGQYLGSIALGAVGGSTGTIVNLFVGVFIGLSSGSSVVLSHAVGSGDSRKIHDTIHTSFALVIICSIFITVVGIAGSTFLLNLVNVPQAMFSYALTYINIYFGGTIFSLIYNMGTALLRAMGDTKRPLYFLGASCITNIILDVVFVVCFNWGVAGVAIATVISQVVSAVLVIITMLHYDQPFRLNFSDIRFNKLILKEILWIGFPAGAQSALYTISNLVISSSCNSYGEIVTSAWAAYGKIDSLYWNTIGAMGTTITTIVGQNYGAKKYNRVTKELYIGWLYAAIIALLCSFIFIEFGPYIYLLFTNETDVIESGMNILKLLAPWFILFVSIEAVAGAFRGCGNVLIPTIITLLGVVVVRIVWIMFTSSAATVTIPLLCYPISWGLSSLLFIIYLYIIKKGKVY